MAAEKEFRQAIINVRNLSREERLKIFEPLHNISGHNHTKMTDEEIKKEEEEFQNDCRFALDNIEEFMDGLVDPARFLKSKLDLMQAIASYANNGDPMEYVSESLTSTTQFNNLYDAVKAIADRKGLSDDDIKQLLDIEEKVFVDEIRDDAQHVLDNFEDFCEHIPTEDIKDIKIDDKTNLLHDAETLAELIQKYAYGNLKKLKESRRIMLFEQFIKIYENENMSLGTYTFEVDDDASKEGYVIGTGMVYYNDNNSDHKFTDADFKKWKEYVDNEKTKEINDLIVDALENELDSDKYDTSYSSLDQLIFDREYDPTKKTLSFSFEGANDEIDD